MPHPSDLVLIMALIPERAHWAHSWSRMRSRPTLPLRRKRSIKMPTGDLGEAVEVAVLDLEFLGAAGGDDGGGDDEAGADAA